MGPRAIPWAPEDKDSAMNVARKLAVTVAATVLSVGLVGLTSAPAQADTSWGCGGCVSKK